MVFHEITREAIQRALGETRDIDERLVDAQETRRILDRLYGYEVSPVLWKKVTQRLSAGRVQSVATRLVVERERERMRFVAAGYWDLVGTFDPGAFEARLAALGGLPGRAGTRLRLRREAALGGRRPRRGACARGWSRSSVAARSPFAPSRSRPTRAARRRPSAPRRCSRRRAASSASPSQTTMRVAQKLYENGYITYMRTDSTNLSETALAAARAQAAEVYGPEYGSRAAPRVRAGGRRTRRRRMRRSARPATASARPSRWRGELSRDEHALYELVWKRTIASQMKDAAGQTVKIRLGATTAAGEDAEFRAAGTVITFPGFLLAYEEGRDEPADEEEQRRLPQLEVGQAVEPTALEAEGHETIAARALHGGDAREGARGPRHRPPLHVRLDPRHDPRPRLRLQEGDGARADVPRVRGDAAARAALRAARRLRLHGADGGRPRPDRRGRARQRVDWLRRFYFGNGDGTRACTLSSPSTSTRSTPARSTRSRSATASSLRVGRYGPYLSAASSGRPCPRTWRPTSSRSSKAEELLAAAERRPRLGDDPETGRELVVANGRYGPYVTEVLPEGADGEAADRLALRVDVAETVTLDEALQLLSLPRTLGGAGRRGDPRARTAATGRTSRRAARRARSRARSSSSRSRSTRRWRCSPSRSSAAAAPRPAAAAGARRRSGRASKPMVVKEGRFGPYVTDGETNASLRRGRRPRRSRSSERSSCSPSAARKGPARSAARHGGVRRRSASVRTNVQTFCGDGRL